MKLVTYSDPARKSAKTGVIGADGGVIDIAHAAKVTRVALPFNASDMISLVASSKKGLAAIKKAVARVKASHYRLAKVKLYAPIPRPRKNVFCVGWNYLDHFNEGAKASPHVQEMPAHPAFFSKQPLTINNPYGNVPAHGGVTEKLDWEVELALVIGPGGTNITEANAMKHVYGYMVANDVSAREVQRHHGQQWFRGKSLNRHLPIGPWIVTADEVRDPNNLNLLCRVNGVIKQSSNTRHLYFKLPRIIAELSAGLTLEAGDIILTGTPSGVGHARTPPEFMKPGDIMETEIEGIGLLRNKIVR
jgi:2-keto-4-pentenoate hydratase/2-oxohepta-3-ene-1,7-dioic acid hydratase in catechol pathway